MSDELERLDKLQPGHRRMRLAVEYDGTDFFGWQRQSLGRGRTVQGTLEEAVARITGAPAQVVGAGRTDTGVHATGQVAHFDTTWVRGDAELWRAMNAVLPTDVAVRSLAEAPPGFHARFSATAREYVYSILNRPTRSPVLARTTWHIAEALDVNAMAAGAAVLVGRADFRAFGKPMRPGGSTVREVQEVAVTTSDERVLVRVRADAFLRHMARKIVYALAEIGRQRLTVTDLDAIRAAADPRPLGMAPPQGLCLVGVTYTDDDRRCPGTSGRPYPDEGV